MGSREQSDFVFWRSDAERERTCRYVAWNEAREASRSEPVRPAGAKRARQTIPGVGFATLGEAVGSKPVRNEHEDEHHHGHDRETVAQAGEWPALVADRRVAKPDEADQERPYQEHG